MRGLFFWDPLAELRLFSELEVEMVVEALEALSVNCEFRNIEL